MALGINSSAVRAEAQYADTAAKVHTQLLSSMLTGLKVLRQAPANHDNVFGLATTAAGAADTVMKLFPGSLCGATGAGQAQHSTPRSASTSAAAQEPTPPAAQTSSAEYWSTWLTPADVLYAAAAPVGIAPVLQLTAAANAGGVTPWLVLVGR